MSIKQLIQIISDDAETIVNNTDLYELQGQTVLLTGAHGLLGVYFLACIRKQMLLMKKPIKVTAVTRGSPHSYYLKMFQDSNFNMLQGDLTDPGFCNSLPNADYIIHTAGYAQPSRFLVDPIKTLSLSTTTTMSLLDKLNRSGKFLFLSSSEIYSGSTNSPHVEQDIGTTNPSHPRACYIEGKRCGEAICNSYRIDGVQAKSARLSLAYGPGTKQGDTRVLNSFIEKALAGTITMLDNGSAERNYCYVSDAVEMMWKIFLFGTSSVYNVAGKSQITIKELAMKIGNVLNAEVQIPSNADFVDGIGGAPKDVQLDMSLFENEFNKFEYTNFSDGLRKTIEWQKSLYNIPSS